MHSAYGLGKRERENAILTDEQGAFYHSMRISYNGEEERERFELYFPAVPEGDYTLTLPYLCMSKEENSQTVTLDLPTGEENYKTCDETVLFADGNGFHIVGIERTEYIENIVNVNPDGSLESVIELKQWTYALDYEAISMEGELEFCTALIQTINTEYVKGIDEKERPTVTINQTANIESVEIYFTNPVYIWDQELKWNVLIRESE